MNIYRGHLSATTERDDKTLIFQMGQCGPPLRCEYRLAVVGAHRRQCLLGTHHCHADAEHVRPSRTVPIEAALYV